MKGGGGASIKKKTISKSKQSKAKQQKQVEVSVDKPKRKGQSAKEKTKNKIEREATKAKGKKKNTAPSFKTLSLQEPRVRRSSPATIAVPASEQQPAVRQSDPALGNEDDSAEEDASISRSGKKNQRVSKQSRQRKSTVWINGGHLMPSNPDKNLVSELALTFS
jgi:hypothetical protein